MRIAARYAKWLERGSPPTVGLPASGVQPGVPILTQQFGDNLNLVVEVAWGANILADSSTWAWTELTRDVLYNGGRSIQITPGRADESSVVQPARCQLRLRNQSGWYTQGGQSPYYPNVKRGTPVRVRVIYNGSSNTRFFGYFAQLTPGWDTTGRFAYVDVVASGAKRRLLQKKAAVASPMTRTIPTLSNIVAFWPCEDGSSSTQLASGLTVGSPIAVVAGTLQPAKYSSFPGSAAVPTFNVDSWFAQPPAYVDNGSDQIRFLIDTPNAGLTDQTRILRVVCNGSVGSIEVRYSGTPANGGLRLMVFDPVGSTLGDTGTVGFSTAGAQVQMGLSWTTSGGNLAFVLSTINIPTTSGPFINLAVNSQSITNIVGLQFAPDANLAGVSIGEIYIQGAVTTIFDVALQASGYTNEYTGARLTRLAAEQGEFLVRTPGATYQRMGVQAINSYLNLMETASQVELGILYDGFAQGLSFIAQDEMTSAMPAITLDASQGQVTNTIGPVDDDQQTVNTFTTTRTSGASYTYRDTASTQSVSAIGVYDGSATVDLYSDGQQLFDYTTWQVGQGTFAGYRYPTVEFWLHRNPELLSQWLAAYIGCRLTINNLINVRTQMQLYTLDQLVQGWAESIDQYTWNVTTNCTPFDVWRVGEVAQDTGDTNPFVMRVDTDGSSTVTQINPGDVSCQVAVNAGALWTTVADDFPINLNIGGYEVVVTAISGSSPQQTFTLSWYTPLPPTPIPPGSPVTLWAPTVLDVLKM